MRAKTSSHGSSGAFDISNRLIFNIYFSGIIAFLLLRVLNFVGFLFSCFLFSGFVGFLVLLMSVLLIFWFGNCSNKGSFHFLGNQLSMKRSRKPDHEPVFEIKSQQN